MVLSEETRKKPPVTPPGIYPGTFRLVAQCLNHYATPGPNNNNNNKLFYFARINKPNNHVKKNQLYAQLIIGILHQTVHVSGISMPVIRRYNRMYTTKSVCYPSSTTDSHLKRISTSRCIHTVVPPDDGNRYARNVYTLTKYTNNKLCVKLGFCLHGYIEVGCQQNIKKTRKHFVHLINI